MRTSRILFLLLLLFVQQIDMSASKKNTLIQLQHIEPTFWWIDMTQSTFQLMLHGNEIADCEVEISYPGVQLVEKKLTDNPNFIFLYLDVEKIAQPGLVEIKLTKGRSKYSFFYELKARKAGSAFRESFSEKDNIYLIMPDRFANGNTQNDAVHGYVQGVDTTDLSQRQGGDIEGIIGQIPYLADLGITTLWTTPMFDNNDTQYSYHHYAASDYYKIDPRLGSNDDYVRLSEVARTHGIKMILDMVPNHCGSTHWWVTDLPASDWFNKWDSYTPTNYRVSVWTDPHASQYDKQKLTNGWFATNTPDLNLSNPLLFDYLRQVYVFWIERADIAGLRIDTYPYNDIHVAARFVQSIRNEYPNMNMVGECWVKSPAEIAYYQSGNNNKDGFDSRVQSVMDFVLKDRLVQTVNEVNGWETGVDRLYTHFVQDFVYNDVNLVMNFLDNHDIDRFSISVGNDLQKYKMGLALVTTVRGYPQIYYGTEIMLEGWPNDYQGCRFRFPGGWPNDSRNAFTPQGRTDKENEVFEYLKALLNFRKNNTALQSGKMIQFIPENGVYVFFRKDTESTVMVIVNNNSVKVNVPTERYGECIQNFEIGVDIISRQAHDIKQPIEVEGKSVLVLKLCHWL